MGRPAIATNKDMQRRVAISFVLFLMFATPVATAQDFSFREEVKGGSVKRLNGETADLPPSALPGVKLMSAKAFFAKYKERSKAPSGLYILDANFVAPTLPNILKRDGLTLKKDGSLLTKNGQKETMLVLSPVSLAVETDKQRKSGGN